MMEISLCVQTVIAVLGLVLSIPPMVANPAEPPSKEEIRNLEYIGIYEHAIALADGLYEGAPFVPGGASRPRVKLLEGLTVTADLDSDGNPEVVVLLGENSGGSGENIYLAVLARRGNEVKNLDTRLLGDRVQIQELSSGSGVLRIKMVQAGSDDAACCPTEMVERTFKLKENSLEEGKENALGSISIESLEGVTWKLIAFSRDRDVPEDLPITAIFENGRIAGNAGCNRYFADAKETSPGEISLSEIGSTMMACPEPRMEAEQTYLSLLQRVSEYKFQLGKLALVYREGEMVDMLLFLPVED